MRDSYNDIGFIQSFAPAARNATANGTGVDLLGFSGAVLVIHAGAWTDGTHTFDIQDSDDNSTFASVAAGLYQGTKPVVSSSGTASKVYKVGYLGAKRYLRVSVTVAGATTGAVYGASILLGHAATKPVA
ncbi:hypothetical protein FJ959_08900 [Mesorhizobium sp. B2-2-4]|uniref:hypothetical protein n=1 Tax=unclassified Mesorhizobium TaxID=325217 RepID=UPI0011261188|nr:MULTISPECIES: hypothetical protein [unclassified Mesorhizobium]TPM58982.1 hypothetical protein FJ959_08900 [Mesorhizobium sp. B2-2-4]TPM67467.1 hypothetical protein FJ965_10040 [Mesorhizobium sp. B2-2-1]